MSVKVLLVEDDAWLAEVEAEMLQSAGFEVRYAPHAQSAIEQIDDRLPDVIVLDMLLTGTTAVALLNELQSHGDSRHIPVILCSNLASFSAFSRGMATLREMKFSKHHTQSRPIPKHTFG